MSFIPQTFRPLHEGWQLTAVSGPVPADIAAALEKGIPAHVPGEAHLDLLRENLIADPFDGDNESQQQWIGDTSWRYQTKFNWQPSPSVEPVETTRHDLVAYGLDTVATVELNGTVIGKPENMFRAYRWDVDDLLVPGENTLTITFKAPVPETLERAEKLGKMPQVNHHEFNQIRKMACSFGWDWGIDVAGAGIWQPIGLDSWSGVRIASVRPLVDVQGTTGILNAHVEIERAADNTTDVPVTVAVTAPSGQQYTASGTVRAGETSTVVQVQVPDAELWWPIGHGAQPLYNVAIKAGDDNWQGRVGFRTVRLDTKPDGYGSPFNIYVNGELILIRGYNWIPDHAFLTEVTPERYARGIRDTIESGANMLRVWGGGIYESDVLYDMADELGILMWQDFLFACAAYHEDEDTKKEVEAEARHPIPRRTAHPALVNCYGSNENIWGQQVWGWSKVTDDIGWGDYYYSELFPELLGELDPTRAYCPSSPFSFGKYRFPNDQSHGTIHEWEVWNREDYTKYRDKEPRFVSEFGFQGPPAWSTLNNVVHDEPMDPFGHQMLVHQKANLGNKKLERGWQGHLPDPQNIEDWHWTTQLNQGAAIRYGIEHFRSMTPGCSGTILWQLNDNWPVVSWAAVDHDGHRKPLWYAVKHAHSPRLATIQPRPSGEAWAATFEGSKPEKDINMVILVNDTGSDYTGDFNFSRQKFDGTVLASATLPATIPARGTAELYLPTDVAAWDDPTGEVVVVAPASADSGFNTAFLDGAEVVSQKLNPAPVSVSATSVDGGYQVTAKANSYARDLFLHADKVDPAAQVDNGMVTIPAGETATFNIKSNAKVDPQEFANTLRSANDLLEGAA